VEMVIPGGMVKGPAARVEFQGDHIACGYWFYQ